MMKTNDVDSWSVGDVRLTSRFLLGTAKYPSPRVLADVLHGLTRGKLLEMARAARAAGKPDAATRVADYCMELAPA